MSKCTNSCSPFTEQDVHHELGYLTVRDGAKLAYVVWRPAKDGKYPSVLIYATYAESGTPFGEAKRFLEAGYAFVGVNVRGTGASEGRYSYYQPIEGQDGFDVVEWIARQAWSTGDVGMIGGSYQGHTQIKVASLQPPHLRAIVPVATEGSEYRDEARPGGLFNAGSMGTWSFDIQPGLGRLGAEARIRAGDKECVASGSLQARNPAYDEVLLHPLYDEWWRARALDTMVERVVVPTLLIHAWQDEWIRANGALRLFKLLRCVYKKLIVQNGPHRVGAYRINQKEQMRWLDRWVKGVRNGIETEPAVTVHWEVTEPKDSAFAAPNWTTTYCTWPIPNRQWLPLYLTAEGELSAEKPNSPGGSRCYLYPLGTELVGTNEQFALEPHPLGTVSYRTKPMPEDMVILGAPLLSLYFATDNTDTDFMFTLKDIDPSNNVLFLQRAVLRASMREVDQSSSTPDEIIQSFARVEQLVPGRVTELQLSLSALGHVVRKGHRLELSILAPSQIPNPVWAFVTTSASSVNEIHHGSSYPSKLSVPVVPDERAQKDAPRLGSLKNQPYRSGVNGSAVLSEDRAEST